MINDDGNDDDNDDNNNSNGSGNGSGNGSAGNRRLADARRALRSWIVANGNGLTDDTLSDTTPLFANHHLSSLHMPELILTLERLRGRRIDLSKLKAPDLRDVQVLCARFLEACDE